MADYQVRLDFFEGPLDLLVYLIRKNEIDIYDIPIAMLTEQYMAYMEDIEALDLDQAGDFLMMAATLLQIKSRMLLPGPDPDDEDYEDPRTELVEKILEYMQFREIAEKMREYENEWSTRAARGYSEIGEIMDSDEEEIEPEVDASINELILAFGRLMLRAPEPEPVHSVKRETVTTGQRVTAIRKALAMGKPVHLGDIVPVGSTRMFMVVTIIALLEMAKRGELKVEQTDTFGEVVFSLAGKKKGKTR